MARFDMKCHTCPLYCEIESPFGQKPECPCPVCGKPMQHYFGLLMPLINLGYQESRYSNETDRDIAKFQFEHL